MNQVLAYLVYLETKENAVFSPDKLEKLVFF